MSANGLLRYVYELKRGSQDRLYGDGWACQGLLRSLPQLSRLYALRLCFVDSLPIDWIKAWPGPSGHKKHAEALKMLKILRLVEDAPVPSGAGGPRQVRLHTGFAEQLRNSLRIGGVLEAEGERGVRSLSASGGGVQTPEATPTLAVAELARHSHATWERLLQAILTPPRRAVKLAMQVCDAARTPGP